jgi:hypothetical protein
MVVSPFEFRTSWAIKLFLFRCAKPGFLRFGSRPVFTLPRLAVPAGSGDGDKRRNRCSPQTMPLPFAGGACGEVEVLGWLCSSNGDSAGGKQNALRTPMDAQIMKNGQVEVKKMDRLKGVYAKGGLADCW